MSSLHQMTGAPTEETLCGERVLLSPLTIQDLGWCVGKASDTHIANAKRAAAGMLDGLEDSPIFAEMKTEAAAELRAAIKEARAMGIHSPEVGIWMVSPTGLAYMVWLSISKATTGYACPFPSFDALANKPEALDEIQALAQRIRQLSGIEAEAEAEPAPDAKPQKKSARSPKK